MNGENIPATVIGLFAGLLLAIAATTGGFTGFLLGVVLGGVGLVVGRLRDNGVDPSSLLGKGRGRG